NLYYTRMLLSESVTTLAVTAFVFCGVRAMKSDGVRAWLASGVALGVTILSRGEYLLLPLALAGYALIARRGKPFAVRNAAAFILATACVVLPWSARNLRTFHRPIPVSVGGLGPGLYVGTFESKATWRDWGVYADEVFVSTAEKQRFER